MNKNSSPHELQKLESFGIKQLKKEEGLLYRYDSIDNALKLLEGETIFFQTPDRFNDPFEFHEGFFKRDLDNSTQFAIRNAIDSNILNKLNENHISNAIQKIRKESGVYCLSKNKNDILMWSHYTDKHKGVCFGFDFTTESMLDRYGAILLSVGYTHSVKPLINLFIRDYITDIMLWSFLKFDIWQYENEVRVYKDGYKGELKINLSHIKEIYLGCNISEIDEKLVKNIVKLKKLNLKVIKNDVSKESFKLETTEI